MSVVAEKMPAVTLAGSASVAGNPSDLHSLVPALEAIKKGTDSTGAEPLRNVAANPTIPEITSKTEGIWTCKDRKLDEASGGYLYTFKLDDACDDITEHPNRFGRMKTAIHRMRALFPAVQPLGFQIAYLDPQSKQAFINAVSRHFMLQLYPELDPESDDYKRACMEILDTHVLPFVEKRLRHADTFRWLGYGRECRADGVYLTLPDRETLLHRWNELRKERLDLPPLDIISIDGDVDPTTFLSLFFKHDVLLASGKEFVHDHIVHVMTTLALALDSGTFVDDDEGRIGV